MAQAIWNGQIIAQSEHYEMVEGNVYFPPEALDMRYFRPSDRHSICFWKGKASYYDIEVDGTVNADAAWFYPAPMSAAKKIAGYVAFWKGVQITR